MKQVIEIKDVSKKFIIPHEREYSLRNTLLKIYKRKTTETFYALKNISFNISKSEFIGIIGINGSGKSTLLKIIADIYKPDSGQVIVKEKISPFLELGIGFNGELSARDNVFLYGAVLGLSKEQIIRKYSEIVNFAELHRFMDVKLKNFSSGMQVRLAFSVAIQSDAPILIVDEVLAVGDGNFQKKCFEVFKNYKKEGKTVVLVSHDLGAIEEWCDTCILINNGSLAKKGTSKEIVKYYKEKILRISDHPTVKTLQPKIKSPNIKKIEDDLALHKKAVKDYAAENSIIKKQLESTDKNSKNYLNEIQKLSKANHALQSQNISLQDEIKQVYSMNNKNEETLRRIRTYNQKEEESVLMRNMVKINKVGVSKKTCQTGEDIQVKIEYQILKGKIEVNFGVGIWDSNGVWVCGNNTKIDKVRIDPSNNKGELTLIIRNNPMNSGKFYVSVSSFGNTKKELYDFQDKTCSFTVINKKKQNGIVTVNHEWSQK